MARRLVVESFSMSIAELRAINQHHPFRPFLIRTAEGGMVEIPHPDFLLIPPVGDTIFAIHPGGGFEIIAASHVTKVQFRKPRAIKAVGPAT